MWEMRMKKPLGWLPGFWHGSLNRQWGGMEMKEQPWGWKIWCVYFRKLRFPNWNWGMCGTFWWLYAVGSWTNGWEHSTLCNTVCSFVQWQFSSWKWMRSLRKRMEGYHFLPITHIHGHWIPQLTPFLCCLILIQARRILHHIFWLLL